MITCKQLDVADTLVHALCISVRRVKAPLPSFGDISVLFRKMLALRVQDSKGRVKGGPV